MEKSIGEQTIGTRTLTLEIQASLHPEKNIYTISLIGCFGKSQAIPAIKTFSIIFLSVFHFFYFFIHEAMGILYTNEYLKA